MCKLVDSFTNILDTDFQMVPSISPESVRLLPDCCVGTLGQGWKWLERFLRFFHTELGTVVTPGGTNCCHLQFRRSRVWVLWDICFLLTWHFRCDDVVGGWLSVGATRIGRKGVQCFTKIFTNSWWTQRKILTFLSWFWLFWPERRAETKRDRTDEEWRYSTTVQSGLDNSLLLLSSDHLRIPLTVTSSLFL